MKRLLTLAATLAIAALVVPTHRAAAQGGNKGKDMPMKMAAPASHKATVTGTVVDVSCKFGQGLSGEEHKMCAGVCADRGLPLAILGSDGHLYIPT